jgi:hypothetical protein
MRDEITADPAKKKSAIFRKAEVTVSAKGYRRNSSGKNMMASQRSPTRDDLNPVCIEKGDCFKGWRRRARFRRK